MAEYTKALRLKPDYLGVLASTLGRTARPAPARRGGSAQLSEAVRLDPDSPEAMAPSAWPDSGQADTAGPITHLEEAIRLDPRRRGRLLQPRECAGAPRQAPSSRSPGTPTPCACTRPRGCARQPRPTSLRPATDRRGDGAPDEAGPRRPQLRRRPQQISVAALLRQGNAAAAILISRRSYASTRPPPTLTATTWPSP